VMFGAPGYGKSGLQQIIAFGPATAEKHTVLL
jgi:replication-associated recombination protein RarA